MFDIPGLLPTSSARARSSLASHPLSEFGQPMLKRARALALNESTRCLVASRSIPETMRKSAQSLVPTFLFKVGDVVADATHD